MWTRLSLGCTLVVCSLRFACILLLAGRGKLLSSMVSSLVSAVYSGRVNSPLWFTCVSMFVVVSGYFILYGFSGTFVAHFFNIKWGVGDSTVRAAGGVDARRVMVVYFLSGLGFFFRMRVLSAEFGSVTFPRLLRGFTSSYGLRPRSLRGVGLVSCPGSGA